MRIHLPHNSIVFQMKTKFHSQVAVTNLNIPFVPKEKINEMATSLMSKYLKKEEKIISKYISTQIKKKVNELLQNLTTENTSETSLY